MGGRLCGFGMWPQHGGAAARAVACTAVSLPDRGDAFKTGTLSFDYACALLCRVPWI